MSWVHLNSIQMHLDAQKVFVLSQLQRCLYKTTPLPLRLFNIMNLYTRTYTTCHWNLLLTYLTLKNVYIHEPFSHFVHRYVEAIVFRASIKCDTHPGCQVKCYAVASATQVKMHSVVTMITETRFVENCIYLAMFLHVLKVSMRYIDFI